jgi:hypothetical protein
VQSNTPGGFFIPPDMVPADAWHRGDYDAGDVLVFGGFTPHCGLPNDSDRLRLSIDIRVQPWSSERPLMGVVVDAGDEHITLVADGRGVMRLRVDGGTMLRHKGYSGVRPRTGAFVGQRVLVSAEGDRAVLVRNPWGYVPADQ